MSDGKGMHFQFCLDGISFFEQEVEYRVDKFSPSVDNMDPHIFRENIVVKEGNKTHIQKRLPVFPSPVELVFKAEKLYNGNGLSAKQISNSLWRPFPRHNISNEKKMKKLIMKMRQGLEENSIVLPKELLSLAVLNAVDVFLEKATRSKYFKMRYIFHKFPKLQRGRSNYACRLLRKMGYIKKNGGCWKRTDKPFDEKDFWPSSKKTIS